MQNFNGFMFTKTLDQLAEKCVREKLPIVEFIQWYEEEGKYNEAGFFGDVGRHGLMGAGLGSAFGGVGSLAGAGLGALYGAGKNLYNRYSQDAGYNTTKQQAIDALQKFASKAPGNEQVINKIINYLSRITPNPNTNPASAVRQRAAKAIKPQVGPPSLEDLYNRGLATKEDMKRLATLPPDQRAAEVERLLGLEKSRQSYIS